MSDERWSYTPGPDPRATAFLDAKGLQRSWRWAAMWEEEHSFGFTLAGVWRMDVLAAAFQLTAKAIAEGETLGGFQTAFEARMTALGFAGPQTVSEFEDGPREVNLTTPARMEVIYDTNLRQAYAASEWQAIVDTQGYFPALEYQGVDDEVTRASHKTLFGIILPVSHPFWRYYFPPNDWFCRCFTFQVSIDDLESGAKTLTTDAELAARGVSLDPADWPTWRDRHTGRTARVPPGIGPGFAYNAGMARRANLAELLAGRLDSLHPDLARAASADLTNLPQFRDLVEDLARGVVPAALETWPVAVAPEALRQIAPQLRPSVVADPAAILRAAERHGLGAQDWSRVQQLLQTGRYTTDADGAVVVEGELAEGGSAEAGGSARAWRLRLAPDAGRWRVESLEPLG